MLKDEFLKTMKQDLVTKNDEILNQLLICFEEVLKEYPTQTEIDSTKTVEECYKNMKKYAREKASNNSYCFNPKQTKLFIIDYLNLKPQTRSFIKLEDFI